MVTLLNLDKLYNDYLQYLLNIASKLDFIKPDIFLRDNQNLKVYFIIISSPKKY